MRVLVTGSRDWRDRRAIREEMVKLGTEDMVLVSGAQRSYDKVTHAYYGADHIAEVIAADLEWDIERHPARWEELGRAAGVVRNGEMVNLGADMCLAFPLPQSKGTIDCMMRCVEAGIPVKMRTKGMTEAIPWTGV